MSTIDKFGFMKKMSIFGIIVSLSFSSTGHADTTIHCIAKERNEWIRAHGWVKKEVNFEYKITITPKKSVVESSGAQTMSFDSLSWIMRSNGKEIQLGSKRYLSTFNIKVLENISIDQLPSGTTITAWLSRWHYNEMDDDGVYLNWVDTATCKIK